MPVLENVTASGADESAQRADAVEVIARKPFMVFDMTATSTGGATTFSTLVADEKIVTVERVDERGELCCADAVPMELRRRSQ